MVRSIRFALCRHGWLQLSRIGLAGGLLVAVSPVALTQAIAAPPTITIGAGLTNITPTGLTGTTVAHPTTTSTVITTNTVSTNVGKHTGFNDFTAFQVGQGVVVDLRIPTGSVNLVNIVHGGAVQLDGTIYSHIDDGTAAGRPGGQVFFVAPQGLIIGTHGTVNVGALFVETGNYNLTTNGEGTVTFGSNGLPGGAIKILNRTLGLDGTGSIVVQGTIKADDSAGSQGGSSVYLLSGNPVSVASKASITAGPALFTATVSADSSFKEASFAEDQGGDIVLTGSAVDVGGALTDNTRGAIKITSTAGGITLNRGSRVQADGSVRLTSNQEIGVGDNVGILAGGSINGQGTVITLGDSDRLWAGNPPDTKTAPSTGAALQVFKGFGPLDLTATTGSLTVGSFALLRGSSVSLTAATLLQLGPTDTVIADSADATLTAGSLRLGEFDTVQAFGPVTIDDAGTLNASDQVTLESKADGVFVNAASALFDFGLTVLAPAAVTFDITPGDLTFGPTNEITGSTVTITATGGLTLGRSDRFTATQGPLAASAAFTRLGGSDTLSALGPVTLTDRGALNDQGSLTLESSGASVSVIAASASFGSGLVGQAVDAFDVVTGSGPLIFGGHEHVKAHAITLTSPGVESLGDVASLTTVGGGIALTAPVLQLGVADTINGGSSLKLAALSSITGGSSDTLSVFGGPLSLSGQSIQFGSTLHTHSTGVTTLSATGGALTLGAGANLNSASAMVLNGPGGVSVGPSSVIQASGQLSWFSYQSVGFGAADTIHAGSVAGQSGPLTFGPGDTLTALGPINLNSAQSMSLASLTSSGLITLTSAAGVFDNGQGQPNLTGGQVIINASGGAIGSSTDPLTVKTGNLFGKSSAAIWLKSLSTLYSKTLIAPSVTLNGQAIASN